MIFSLKEHLHEYTQQMIFKCPICNSFRFGSFDKLKQHLIFIHHDSIVYYVVTDDMMKQEKGDTFEDENEDYVICKAFAKHCDREFIVGQKSFYGIEDLDL
uniref:FBX41/ZN365 C2H2-type zinc finger domain-containing protein n=1 Tax=Rhizophagus irregularis (strain DAOM 181602 / DAOM 197198 / MUCL 43194) TaxID=747089 RepID=U9V780_RHIID